MDTRLDSARPVPLNLGKETGLTARYWLSIIQMLRCAVLIIEQMFSKMTIKVRNLKELLKFAPIRADRKLTIYNFMLTRI
jgi:hypothetical protein